MSANFYELLKYAATGQASPGMTYYDRMRASALMGGGVVQTLTGQPPLSFKADGTPLISWSMKGNGSQSGTPTPDNPVMPTFCGVRTGNLWNEDYTGISGSLKYVPVYVGDGSFTLSTSCPAIKGDAALFLLAGNVQSGASTVSNGVYKNRPITVTSSDGYVTVAYRHFSYAIGSADPRDEQTMLNLGSTALPYEPYGWAEKITCAGQTVPVYLGEVPTVRRVRKLVLDGTEDWNEGTSNYYIYIDVSGRTPGVPNSTALSTHTESGVVVNNNGQALFFKKSVFVHSSLADFQSYIQRQYAAGTPVTIWYVLATEQTGIVNEPLCKISTYADELSSEDAGVTIPTIRGQNTLTVDTELQPSEMTITYRN